MTTLTLDLPEDVVRRAQQAADALNRPLAEVLTEVLAAALPDMRDAPTDMQDELSAMTWLSDNELQSLAQGMMPEDKQRKLRELSSASHQTLIPSDAEMLDFLQREYGQVTLRKARAYALLSLRSGRTLLASQS